VIDKYLYDQPGHLIRRANQIATAAFVEETSRFGITPVQYAMLVALHENPGLDATRLSELIAIDRATIGNVASRLEARGFLSRAVDERDMRAKQIFVTEAGASVIEAIKPMVGQIADRMLARLGPTEREQLMSLLGQLVDIEGTKMRSKQAREQQ
jgi:DNA-binding MarR family transcriptional regulator